jgi:hypothetical protein
MSNPLPTTEPPSDLPQDARAQQRLEMLRELAEIGMTLARGVERQAQAPEAGDLGLVFARIARAVRQTLALEARLEGELQVRARKAAFEREQDAASAARAPVRERARIVRRAVKRAIEAEADDDEAEQLIEDLDERLCDREDDEDFLDRPVGELVALICKDLGVTPDLSLWEDEAWARAETAQQAVVESAEAPGPEPGRPLPPAGHARPAVSPGWMSG